MIKLLTLGEVAELSGLSYSRIHEMVASGKLPAVCKPADGRPVWLVKASDARKVKRRPPATDTRKAVMVRVPVATYQRWERAAAGEPVSAWLWALGDAAAK